MQNSYFVSLLNFSLFYSSCLAIYNKLDLRANIWPHPYQYIKNVEQIYLVENLEIVLDDKITHCLDILHDNIKRYDSIFLQENLHWGGTVKPDDLVEEKLIGESVVQKVYITFNSENYCFDYPQLNDDESYQIDLNQKTLDQFQGLKLSANTIWGVIRGLETISQMYFVQSDSKYMFETQIVDQPRFSHRGFFLDTSRHFMVLDIIKQMLDGMAYNKLNVFHWHMVNDQSFSYGALSDKYSFLYKNGAYPPYQHHIYTKQDVEYIIEYARMRGIRVYPEFDTPGHVRSWCDGFDKNDYPQFCMKCLGNEQDDEQNDQFYGWGPVNPSKDENYDILNDLWSEIRSVFKDNFIHVGGDEVPDNCWLNSDDETNYVDPVKFRNWAGSHNFTTKAEIQRYHLDKMYAISEANNFKFIVWNEAEGFDDEIEYDDPAYRTTYPIKPIIHIWMPWGNNITSGWEGIAERATQEGYQIILSSTWYLDLISYPYEGGHHMDWTKFYATNPTEFTGSAGQKSAVLGGEGAWWTEYIDSSGVVSRTFPRLSAMAERWWSKYEDTNDVEDAFPRLDQFRCTMVNRKLPAEPIGTPSSCHVEFDVKYQPLWDSDDCIDSSVRITNNLIYFLTNAV